MTGSEHVERLRVAWLIANSRDGNRPKPVSFPVRMRASTLARAVAGFQVLDRSLAGRGVGGDDLVAPAFDGVEQDPLGATRLRRLVETVDAGVVDRLVCAWLAARLGEPAGSGCRWTARPSGTPA